ncbi:hypothetical protein E5S69_11750 [Cupriavidus necator]|uniref:hypothetical protein n=1 Tax=Cupriavidus necator TaxID=106590 RepID=UPI00148F8AC8|nr:hypothetical protein [Cupriavidus necator]NOV24186.1 hypothetical protein [Cupriavidus necator]
MRLAHYGNAHYPYSTAELQHVVDDFGVEHRVDWQRNEQLFCEPAYQLALHYLDGHADPDFHAYVWRKQ